MSKDAAYNEPVVTGWVRTDVLDSSGAGRQHAQAARTLLGGMRSMYGVNQRIADGEPGGFYRAQAVLPDGTLIEVRTNDGIDDIRITPREGSKPPPVAPHTPWKMPVQSPRAEESPADPIHAEAVQGKPVESRVDTAQPIEGTAPEVEIPADIFLDPIEVQPIDVPPIEESDNADPIPGEPIEERAPPVELPEEGEEPPTKEPTFTYVKRSYCSVGGDRRATSAAFRDYLYLNNVLSFDNPQRSWTNGLMVDDTAVYVCDGIGLRAPAEMSLNTLYTLDGGTMAVVGVETLIDRTLLSSANAVTKDLVLYRWGGAFIQVFDLEIETSNRQFGGGASASYAGEAGTPIVLWSGPTGEGVVVSPGGTAQILSASSLTSIGSTMDEFGLGASQFDSYFIGNGVIAVSRSGGEIEVTMLDGAGGFSAAAPATSGLAFRQEIVVMADRQTMWFHLGSESGGSLYVYRDGEWSDQTPRGLEDRAVLLYDPISDAVALAPNYDLFANIPTRTDSGTDTYGSTAWIFDAKDCMRKTIPPFTVDLGESVHQTRQFLGGALVTSTRAFTGISDIGGNYEWASTFTKHVIGVLRQTRVDEYEEVDEGGAARRITQGEYESAPEPLKSEIEIETAY